MLGVWDKLQPKEMCFHGVFRDDPKAHYFRKRETIGLEEHRNDCKDAHA
jgi:hypothetical protein